MVRLFLLFFGLAFLEAQPAAVQRPLSLQQMVRDVWTIDHGLPQNAVNAILQTRDGYLWVGTQEGVARFDGIRFTVFDKRSSPAFTNNNVFALFEDRAGTLWIGTAEGLFSYHNSTIAPFDSAHTLHTTPVRAFWEDDAGRLWIGTRAGLFCLENGLPVSLPCQSALEGTVIRALVPEENGRVWIATDGGGLYLCARDSSLPLKRFTTANGLASNSLLSAERGSDGSLWIGTNGNYLNRFVNGRIEHYSPANGFPGRIVYTVFHDKDGTMWFGSGDGLSRYPGMSPKERFTTYDAENALNRSTVYSLLRDREGCFWVGTFSGGLHRFLQGMFLTQDVTDGLSNDFVYCVLQNRAGTIFIGSDGGGLDEFLPSGFKNFSTKNGLPGNSVFSLLEDSHGNLWIGTFGDGLSRYAHGKFTSFSIRDGLCNNFIRAIAEGRDGSIWVGTRDGLSRFRDGTFATFTTTAGLTSNYIRTLLVDSKGLLWIGTFGGGVCRFEDSRFTSVTVAEGLTSNDIRSLYEDPEGALWIGTDGGGLNRLKDGHVDAVTIRQGLHDDVVLSIIGDGHGNVWMSCNKGVFRASLKELNDVANGTAASLSCISYGKADGINNPECNAGQPSGILSSSGRLWFPTAQGIISVDPQKASPPRPNPPVVVERLVVNNEEEYLSGPVSVQAGRDIFEIQYTALSFLSPEKIRFRYRLEPFNRQWVEAGSRRNAFYTNLPPGHYTFHVAAGYTGNELSGSVTSFEFTLLPFFYETPAFFLVTVVLLVGIGSGAVVGRLRAIRQREEELRGLVETRTKSLQEQTRVAQEANAVKSHLLGIAAHDLKSPLVSMKGFAGLIKEEIADNPSAVQKSETIQRLSQSMLDLINELLDSESIESGRVHLSKRRVDISSLILTAVEIVRLTAERKNQRLELSIPTAGTCWVDADPERLRDIFLNLLSNAIKYSPRGARIWITASSGGLGVRVAVRDEGPGLSTEDQSKLFGRFQRLTPRPTGGESSTGLGLAIAKHLVELHGGTIAVTSRVGEGSTFTIELTASAV